MNAATPPPAVPQHDALPPGTRFGELEIIRVLGVGGFGIVYLARDHSLEREVALKEYMPAALAARGAGAQITVRSVAYAETYAAGLRSFVNEARLLARFNHPALLKVYRFWEANGSAYMVMPYLQGRNLRDERQAMASPPSEDFIVGLLNSMLSALTPMHGADVYHRDIAPDNILMSPDGAPILLDFGAARRVITDRTQSLTAILKPSYAPIEQYPEMTQMRQGPWTDLYALGAVAHFLVFGKPPPPATARVVQDNLIGLAQRVVPGISQRLLAIVGWMLAVHPQHRPQSVAELHAVLNGNDLVPELGARPTRGVPDVAAAPMAFSDTLPSDVPEAVDDDATIILPGQRTYSTAPAPASPAPAARAQAVGPVGPVVQAGLAPSLQPPAGAERAGPVEPPLAANPPRRFGKPALAAAVLLVVAAALGAWQFSRPRSDLASAGPPAGAAPVALGSPAASVVVAVAVAPQPAPASAIETPAAPALSAPITPAAPAVATTPVSPAPAALPAPPARVAIAAVPLQPAPKATVKAAARAVTPAPAASRDMPAARSPAPVLAATPEPTAPPAPDPAPKPAAAAVATAPDGPATATEACGRRVFIALWTCMDRECEKPQYRDHPECVKVLEVKRRRSPQ